jgi:hypothetical protein
VRTQLSVVRPACLVVWKKKPIFAKDKGQKDNANNSKVNI